MTVPYPVELAGGAVVAILVLDRAVQLVKNSKNGKNGNAAIGLLHDLKEGQVRTNTLLENLIEQLRGVR